MTTQIAIRLEASALAALDAEVAQGRAANRSDAVRRAIAYLERQQRYRRDEEILADLARRGELEDPELQAWVGLPTPPID